MLKRSSDISFIVFFINLCEPSESACNDDLFQYKVIIDKIGDKDPLFLVQGVYFTTSCYMYLSCLPVAKNE